MNSLLFIAKNNLKKHKGEAVILFALIFMAAVLLFSSTALIMSGNNAVNEVIEKNNVSDLLLFAQLSDPLSEIRIFVIIQIFFHGLCLLSHNR